MNHDVLLTLWQEVSENYQHEKEYLQTVRLFLENIEPALSVYPEAFELSLLKRIIYPDRVINFKVTWVDDSDHIQVNQGYRVQHNNALGPYKGGVRFHPSVNQSICKFLAFDQTFKNALTNTMIGGAKGGSDFDPKGKSEMEVMRFAQAYAMALHPFVGPDWDVPAGDIGVGYRETGYMVGMIRALRQAVDGTFTGKAVGTGGSLGRKEATGYGLCYIVEKALNDKKQTSLQNKRVVISGSGNVAIYAAFKAVELGATVVAMSDSDGYIVDEQGIDLNTMVTLKEQHRRRIKEYVHVHPHATYVAGESIWQIPCEVALPCATQNEMNDEDVKTLILNGVMVIGEGANMPLTPKAIKEVTNHQLLYIPGIASNAGGVAVSALEMSQNASKTMWTFDQVDEQLKTIMIDIYDKVVDVATTLKQPNNLLIGAQVAGYLEVAKAMKHLGVI